MQQYTRKPRGLAALSPERRRHIAGLGGKASHLAGTAHEWTSEEASEAGRKGQEVLARLRQAKRGEP